MLTKHYYECIKLEEVIIMQIKTFHSNRIQKNIHIKAFADAENATSISLDSTES